MLRIFLVSILALWLSSCGTYRSGSGGYASNTGSWRTGSDYVQDPATRNFYMNEKRTVPTYIPQGEFKLFYPTNPVKLNRGYRPASDPNHEGIDLGGPKGTPILAAHEGVVIYAGRDFRGYGNMVIIEYDPNWATLYGHLDKVTTREGMPVKPGDPIGTMGKTGKASGVHLHFELIHQKSPVDPLPMFARGSRFAGKR